MAMKIEKYISALWSQVRRAAPAPNFQLFVDRAFLRDDGMSIEGWARDPSNPKTAVTLDFLHRSQIIGSSLCDQWRPDLELAGYGGAHGFSAKLPILYPDEFEMLSVRMHGTDKALRFEPVRVADERTTAPLFLPFRDAVRDSAGSVDRFREAICSLGYSGVVGNFAIKNGGLVIGWALDLGRNPEPVEIVVRLDEQELWKGSADRKLVVHDLASQLQLSCGFRVTVPSSFKEGAKVQVQDARTGTSLSREVGRLSLADRFVGSIDAFHRYKGRVEVSGWVHDKARPYDALAVSLQVNGATVSTGMADVFRKDLQDAHIGSGKHGFVFTADDVGGDTVNVRVMDSMFALVCEHATVGSQDTSELPLRLDPSYSGVVEGKFERITDSEAIGWARNVDASDVPVLLDLHVDGFHYSSTVTRGYRGDVAKARNSHGYHGFVFEIPPTHDAWNEHRLQITPRVGQNRISESARNYRSRTKPQRLLKSDRVDLLNKLVVRLSPRPENDKLRVAIIVLTRNGEALIKEFLETFSRYNSYPHCEVIIVDHGSEDRTFEVVKAASGQETVQYIQRGRNYSFSESNNFAAKQTNAEVLIFANNDIEFSGDIIEGIVRVLRDPIIGVVGIGLRDSSFGLESIGPGQHIGVHFRPPSSSSSFVRPFETRPCPELKTVANASWRVPAVTGAFMAIRNADFKSLNGFSEEYIYGYEDVALCLAVRAKLRKEVVCANYLEAEHLRGFTRTKPGDASLRFRSRNQQTLDREYGFWLRRKMLSELLDEKTYWTTQPLRVGFAVTQARDLTAAGDYFTAVELGTALSKVLNADIVFLDTSKTENIESWYDATGLDVLVVMVDNYDVRKIIGSSPHLIKIAWVRNWVDRWPARPWSEHYNLWLASSSRAAEHIRLAMNAECAVLPIATNWDRFSSGQLTLAYQCDYTFTGSFWGAPREISYYLDPAALPFTCKIFGEGWGGHKSLGPYTSGLLPYADLPDVYRSCRVVIDDANHVTRPWGSVNSRVFDAIAAGALPITNGSLGAREIFGELLPVYCSAQDLDDVLMKYLSNEEARKERVAALQNIVKEEHTYEKRARKFLQLLRKNAEQLRISVKIGAPSPTVREEWGDWHFAKGMKRAFTRLGYQVRIDCLDSWDSPPSIADDVVIVLRGLSRYEPKGHQINIMWNISHPDAVSAAEYEAYDHIFVASPSMAETLGRTLSTPAEVLLQCTDPALFFPSELEPRRKSEVLFVGNSRNEYRKIVRDATEMGLPISVYGGNWEGFIPAESIKGKHIKNEELSSYYSSAGVVLNDHWASMKDRGILSNRLFDAAAAGARIISDPVDGIEEIFSGLILTYELPEDLKRKIGVLLAESSDQRMARLRLADEVRKSHSFDVRVARIVDVIRENLNKKMFQGMGSMAAGNV